MPQYKCVPCRTRLNSAASPGHSSDHVCPDCGALLEPSRKPSDVVGFRLITARDHAPFDAAAHTEQPRAVRPDDFLARREAILAQAYLDTDRWVDDGGSLRAEAVALRPPDTTR